MIRIGLAALKQSPSIPEGVEKIASVLRDCRKKKVDIVCFSEAYLPGLRGAKVIFQPQVTGSDKRGRELKRWGELFHEKAMQCRAAENSVYFASVNQAMRYQDSATSLIDPKGDLIDYIPYRKEDLMVADLDMKQATRFYAKRYNPAWYPEN